jgi:hypothetical protein
VRFLEHFAWSLHRTTAVSDVMRRFDCRSDRQCN